MLPAISANEFVNTIDARAAMRATNDAFSLLPTSRLRSDDPEAGNPEAGDSDPGDHDG